MDDACGERRPHDYFDSVPNYLDTLPDFRKLAREIGLKIAATQPNVLAHKAGCSGSSTTPTAERWPGSHSPGQMRARLARRKVWN
ncbi:hypothetical protein GCM10023114_58010 [Mycolicibacterium sediminis]|uniref:Uncharacterized protein n=2 Tax=Mycolicibacterium sediminis TaxID=1286180 RepID=A0A7I7QNZ4_9MYCO|nr:hypothetical protein MSEDJ_22150 [Mycolicibacterium sediminis]